MAYSLKNMWAAMAVTLAAATSLSAAPFYDNQPYGDTLGCCPCGPVRPCVDPCGNWVVEADFIYWNVCEEGLEFGTRFENCESDCFHFGHSRKPDHRWHPGFRVGIGYDLPCDGWDVTATWTNLYARARSDHNNDGEFDGGFLVNFPTFGFFPNCVEAKWSMNLNYLDVELGREFCVSQCVTLRPFIGVRALWINQKYNIDTWFEDSEGVWAHAKNRFSGAGLRSGLESEYRLGWCGLSLYGSGSLAILWGDFRTSFDSDNPFFDEDDDGFFVDCFKNNYCACVATADASIGFRWREYFCCDTVALTVQLGYESHFFWNQNRFCWPTFEEGCHHSFNRGDLCTNGITVGAKVAF